MYTVYVLYSDVGGCHYVGYTSNLPERMISHNAKGKGWTARWRPWRIIYTMEFSDKLEAMRYERWLKTGSGRDFIKQIIH